MASISQSHNCWSFVYCVECSITVDHIKNRSPGISARALSALPLEMVFFFSDEPSWLSETTQPWKHLHKPIPAQVLLHQQGRGINVVISSTPFDQSLSTLPLPPVATMLWPPSLPFLICEKPLFEAQAGFQSAKQNPSETAIPFQMGFHIHYDCTFVIIYSMWIPTPFTSTYSSAQIMIYLTPPMTRVSIRSLRSGATLMVISGI